MVIRISLVSIISSSLSLYIYIYVSMMVIPMMKGYKHIYETKRIYHFKTPGLHRLEWVIIHILRKTKENKDYQDDYQTLYKKIIRVIRVTISFDIIIRLKS